MVYCVCLPTFRQPNQLRLQHLGQSHQYQNELQKKEWCIIWSLYVWSSTRGVYHPSKCYSAIHDTACPTHFLNQFQGCQLVAAPSMRCLSFRRPRRLIGEALSPIPCLNLAAWHPRSTCKMLGLVIHTSLIGWGKLNSQFIVTDFYVSGWSLFKNCTECEKC